MTEVQQQPASRPNGIGAPIDTPADASQKARIMAHLRARAEGDRPFSLTAKDAQGEAARMGHRRKGWTGSNVRSISAACGITPHDVTHALYDLRNRGLLRFSTSKSPGRQGAQGERGGGSSHPDGIPVRILVTPLGMGIEPKRDGPKINRVDATVLDTPAPPKPKREPKPAPPSTPLLSHLGIAPAERPAVTPPPFPADPLAELPLLRSLVNGQEDLHRAVDALRAAGRQDLADLVISETKIGPMEQEFITLWRMLRKAGRV